MKEVMKETFQQEVIESDRPVVLDFWGPQCVPCLSLMPGVETIAEKYGDRIKIAKVEAPKNRRLCIELRVLSLPTFLFYKEGKEVQRLSGEVNLKAIEEAIEKIV
jgi:thioredoxin 1